METENISKDILGWDAEHLCDGAHEVQDAARHEVHLHPPLVQRRHEFSTVMCGGVGECLCT